MNAWHLHTAWNGYVVLLYWTWLLLSLSEKSKGKKPSQWEKEKTSLCNYVEFFHAFSQRKRVSDRLFLQVTLIWLVCMYHISQSKDLVYLFSPLLVICLKVPNIFFGWWKEGGEELISKSSLALLFSYLAIVREKTNLLGTLLEASLLLRYHQLLLISGTLTPLVHTSWKWCWEYWEQIYICTVFILSCLIIVVICFSLLCHWLFTWGAWKSRKIPSPTVLLF